MLEKLGCAKAKDIRDCLLLLEAEAFVDPNLNAQVWPVQVQNHQQGCLGMWVYVTYVYDDCGHD